MTKEDIIRMVRESGFGHLHAMGCRANAWGECDMGCEGQIERFANLIAAAEREAQWEALGADEQNKILNSLWDRLVGRVDGRASAGAEELEGATMKIMMKILAYGVFGLCELVVWLLIPFRLITACWGVAGDIWETWLEKLKERL